MKGWAAVHGRALLATLALWSAHAWAEDVEVNAARAQRNYLLHCVGCHLVDGGGAPGKGIPSMSGTLPRFLQVPGGREYITQVPGVMNSGLNDKQVAELMNWLVPRMGDDATPAGNPRYTAQEIARLRGSRPLDFAATRRALLDAMPQGR
ncbi:cytochrome c [Variovorax sp. J22R133]|uniref:c-type cytochrome n=1 Tax=Variovorax brevis TaxID=3053503 RepID=UPI002574FFB1|nr:cytochrome c [Variovorax sp. J22R133]MDM0111441.1 cytochrome c [Variovorax sp. J22R133]